LTGATGVSTRGGVAAADDADADPDDGDGDASGAVAQPAASHKAMGAARLTRTGSGRPRAP
jgi:hypothetical protein